MGRSWRLRVLYGVFRDVLSNSIVLLSGTYLLMCVAAVLCTVVVSPVPQHKDPAVHVGLILFFAAFLSFFFCQFSCHPR